MKNQKDEAIFHEAGTVGCLLNTEWDGMDEERGGAGQCSTDSGLSHFRCFCISSLKPLSKECATRYSE